MRANDTQFLFLLFSFSYDCMPRSLPCFQFYSCCLFIYCHFDAIYLKLDVLEAQQIYFTNCFRTLLCTVRLAILEIVPES